MTLQTVDHATHVLAGILTEALGKRRRPDLAQAEIDALSALRTLYDLQRKAWRRELAALKGRVARLSAEIAHVRASYESSHQSTQAVLAHAHSEVAELRMEQAPVVSLPFTRPPGERRQ